MNRVALAFSGGLDTTVCVPLLQEEYDYDDVIGITVDVGQPEHEFNEAKTTADTLGIDHYIVDRRAEFAQECFEAVRANATYQGYPLGTALARPVIAEAILEIATDHNCTALAHGCTGKGNDQLRFEAIWRATDLDVIAPIRELGLTRDWELEYAHERDLPVESGNEGAWSIDTNLWSRSIEGDDLEDPNHIPPQTIYEWTEPPTADTTTIDIEFKTGYPISIDGETYEPPELIEYLNDLAGSYGVGRTDLMEDRMLGLKVRENYEHPAASTLLAAHEALEGLVLTKDERSFKTLIENAWAEKAYEGLLAAPLVTALNAFIAATQRRVTGTVTIKFEGGQARPVARKSDYAVYSESAASFDTEAILGGIQQSDATGVAKYHGFQERLANQIIAAADDTDIEALPDGGTN